MGYTKKIKGWAFNEDNLPTWLVVCIIAVAVVVIVTALVHLPNYGLSARTEIELACEARGGFWEIKYDRYGREVDYRCAGLVRVQVPFAEVVIP